MKILQGVVQPLSKQYSARGLMGVTAGSCGRLWILGWNGTGTPGTIFGIFLVLWISHDITDRFGVQFPKFVHFSIDDGYDAMDFILEPQRFQKVRPVEILYEVPIFSGTIKWGCSGCGQEDFEHSLYIHMCLCIYIYNINAFRDHLGIEASGFHASPWTMHIADIYSTEAARFTLQQLQHDQYRQLIGNIYIYV